MPPWPLLYIYIPLSLSNEEVMEFCFHPLVVTHNNMTLEYFMSLDIG